MKAKLVKESINDLLKPKSGKAIDLLRKAKRLVAHYKYNDAKLLQDLTQTDFDFSDFLNAMLHELSKDDLIDVILDLSASKGLDEERNLLEIIELASGNLMEPLDIFARYMAANDVENSEIVDQLYQKMEKEQSNLYYGNES